MDAVLHWLQAALAATVALFSPAETTVGVYYGYVEADYERVAPEAGGIVTELAVVRGDSVTAGQVLARLDDTVARAAVARARAQVAEATARVAQAQAQLADLQKGRRAIEIEALVAQRAQAAAAQTLSVATFDRQRQLVADGVAPAETLDGARAALDRDNARLAEIDLQISAARMGARDDQVVAAEAALAAAGASLAAAEAAAAQSDWALRQRSLVAAAAGVVDDTLFAEGEFVPPGAPVVSLLPDGKLFLRFFVPEPARSGLARGDIVAVACDGCPGGLTARVTYLAPEPEITPPVIFSRDTRAKLVFLVEAAPTPDVALHPGQPVEVTAVGVDP